MSEEIEDLETVTHDLLKTLENYNKILDEAITFNDEAMELLKENKVRTALIYVIGNQKVILTMLQKMMA